VVERKEGGLRSRTWRPRLSEHGRTWTPLRALASVWLAVVVIVAMVIAVIVVVLALYA
jgi:hypothetical protein